jgi:hypothetical protein
MKVSKENEKSFIWLHPEIFQETDSFYIDQKLVHNLHLSEHVGDKTIAIKNSWKLTMKDLIYELKSLTRETREAIKKQDKLNEFIIALGDKHFNNNQPVYINNEILKYVYPIITKIDTIIQPFDDDENIINVDTFSLTFGEIKERIMNTKEEIKDSLKQEQFTRLIEKMIWLKFADYSNMKNDSSSLFNSRILTDLYFDPCNFKFSDNYKKTLFNILQEKTRRDKIYHKINSIQDLNKVSNN